LDVSRLGTVVAESVQQVLRMKHSHTLRPAKDCGNIGFRCQQGGDIIGRTLRRKVAGNKEAKADKKDMFHVFLNVCRLNK
jgi:hypothetical protein